MVSHCLYLNYRITALLRGAVSSSSLGISFRATNTSCHFSFITQIRESLAVREIGCFEGFSFPGMELGITKFPYRVSRQAQPEVPKNFVTQVVQYVFFSTKKLGSNTRLYRGSILSFPASELGTTKKAYRDSRYESRLT